MSAVLAVSDDWGAGWGGDDDGPELEAESPWDDDGDQAAYAELIEEIQDTEWDSPDAHWQATIMLDDGSEYRVVAGIDLIWELRALAIEFGLSFDYEYIG